MAGWSSPLALAKALWEIEKLPGGGAGGFP